jgi:hypothetical protein
VNWRTIQILANVLEKCVCVIFLLSESILLNWPLYCVSFFYLRLPITPLLSSNFSSRVLNYSYTRCGASLIIISLKNNLFSPWYSWKIAELTLNNNHSLTLVSIQGRIQDFKLGWAHLKKILGYFVWKITILRQKILFFPILGGASAGCAPWIRPCIILYISNHL